MKWPWSKRTPTAREQAELEAAKRQLEHARQLESAFEETAQAFRIRGQENNFGARVRASMQPKRRGLPWAR